jgi:hypothetical protein
VHVPEFKLQYCHKKKKKKDKTGLHKFEIVRATGVAQVAEQLCSKCEALSSNPSTAKKKKKYPL